MLPQYVLNTLPSDQAKMYFKKDTVERFHDCVFLSIRHSFNFISGHVMKAQGRLLQFSYFIFILANSHLYA